MAQGVKYPSIKMYTFAYGDIRPKTHDACMGEAMYAVKNKIRLQYQTQVGSALIDKNRSQASTDFIRNTKADVMFMVDHDMQWRQGECLETARLAAENQTIVGALYSKRHFGLGYSCCDGENPRGFQVGAGEHRVEKCERIAGGFTAIHRSVFERIYNKFHVDGLLYQKAFQRYMERGSIEKCTQLAQLGIADCHPGDADDTSCYLDWFRQVRRRNSKGDWNWLGEDFSFCLRACEAGVVPMLNLRPAPVHYGNHGFTVSDGGTKWPPEK